MPYHKIDKDDIDKFLSKIAPNPDNNLDACWFWLGGNHDKDGEDYGAFYAKKTQFKAHTLSYYLFKGEIPEGMVVRHTCDVKACVNPRHLVLGTQSDNLQDALKRERLPNHKLNSEAVKVIKWMKKYRDYYGLTNKLARLYKVNRKAIHKIASGKTWKHIKV